MSDDDKSIMVIEKDDLMPVYVNDVITAGIMRGIVNLKLAVARWSHNEDGKSVPELYVCCDLRMDLFCAKRIRDALDVYIEAATKPAGVQEH